MSFLHSIFSDSQHEVNSLLWELDLTNGRVWMEIEGWNYFPGQPKEGMLKLKDFLNNLGGPEKIGLLRKIIELKDSKQETAQFQLSLLGKNSLKSKFRIVRDSDDQISRLLGSFKIVDGEIGIQEELLRKLIEHSKGCLLIQKVKASHLEIIYCNKEFKDLSGYTLSDIYGQSILSILTSDSHEEWVKVNQQQAGTPKEISGNFKFRKKDGSELWAEITNKPIFDSSGRPRFWICYCKKVDEEAFIELEKRFFYRLNNQLSHAVKLEDRNQIVLEHLSREFDFDYSELWMSNIDYSELYKTSAYSVCENIEKKLGSYFNSTHKGKGLPGLAWKKGDILFISNLITNPDFLRKDTAESLGLRSGLAIPVHFEDKLQGVYLLFSQKDIENSKVYYELLNRISFRLGSELAKLKTEIEIDSFFSTTPDILCIINKAGIIKKINPSFEKYSGVCGKKLLDSHFAQYFAGNHSALVREKIKQAITTEASIYTEAEIYRPDDTDLIFGWTFYYNRSQKLIYISGKNLSTEKEVERTLNRTNELSNMGQWEIDLETNKVSWSKVTRELHAVHETFVPSVERAIQFYKPKYRESLRAKLKSSMRGEIPKWSFIGEIIDQNGREKWVNVTGENVFKNGKCLRIYGNIQNITHEINTRKKLNLSNKRYRIVTEALQIGVWEVILEKDKFPELIWDDAMYDIFGYGKKRDIHPWEAWKQRLHPDDTKYIDIAVEKLIQKKESYNATFRIVLDDGSIKYIKGRGEFISGKNGNPRLIGVNYDVTGEENRRNELIHIKSLKRAVINSTDDLIWAVDKNYTLILANSSYLNTMESITNQKYEVGKKVISATDLKWERIDNQKKSWLKAYQKAFAGEFSNLLFKVKTPNGAKRFFQTYLYPIQSPQKGQKKTEIIGVSCFSRDVTERRNYIETIESQNERLRDIAWLQSHVVRAPLAKIMGLADLIINYELDTIEQKQMLHNLDYTCKELDKVISEIANKTEEEFHVETETFNDR